MPTSKRFCEILGILTVLAAAATGAAAQAGTVFTDAEGVAIRGYDPVAYHTDGRPAVGQERFEAEWNGARWRFATAENREAFLAAPERYAPRYGGYCAWAVSRGELAPIDPNAWKIVDGKLYLNYSRKIQRKWEKDIAGNVERADRHWPELSAGR